MALDAVPLVAFRVSSCSMARMPNGVAALPSPIALAAMLRIIDPIAGWSAGTSGNSRTISGRTVRAMMVSSPPSSATFIRPRNRAMTPISPNANVTDPVAASIIAVPSSCIGPWAGAAASGAGGVQVSCRNPATTKAIRTMAKKMAFKGKFRCCSVGLACNADTMIGAPKAKEKGLRRRAGLPLAVIAEAGARGNR